MFNANGSSGSNSAAACEDPSHAVVVSESGAALPLCYKVEPVHVKDSALTDLETTVEHQSPSEKEAQVHSSPPS